MFVLGVDPGLTRCGFAVVEPVRNHRVRPVALGVLRTDPNRPAASRLSELAGEIRVLIAEFSPAVVAVERIFLQKNMTTGIRVAQAAGVVIAEAAASGCEVWEYSPNEVKAAVAGHGRADKEMVQTMVQRLLGLAERPSPPDVADAAALALCHLALMPAASSGIRPRQDTHAAGTAR